MLKLFVTFCTIGSALLQMTPFSMKYISMDLSLALLAARLFKLQFYVLAE
jgi:hypothetical protein